MMRRVVARRCRGTLRRTGFALAFATAVISIPGAAIAGGTTVALPKLTNCGDIAAGTWLVPDRLSGKALTGRYYSVHAINFPCAKARTLVIRITHMRSPGRGPASLVPGFMCLTGIPAGLQLEHGGCSVGTSPMLVPTAAIRSFRWQACRSIRGRSEHRRCATRVLG